MCPVLPCHVLVLALKAVVFVMERWSTCVLSVNVESRIAGPQSINDNSRFLVLHLLTRRAYFEYKRYITSHQVRTSISQAGTR